MSLRRLLTLMVTLSAACSTDPVATAPDTTPLAPRRMLGALGTVDIQCTAPDNFSTYTLVGAATPVEVQFDTSVAAEIAAGTYEVRAYDNGVLVDTSSSTAPITFALPFGDHRLTLAVAAPTAAPGAGATCSLTVRVTKPCVAASDCVDDFFCSSNACITAPDGTSECAFGAPPVAGCCVSDFDCAAGFCRPETHTCAACATAENCDDSNSCTSDECVAGACRHEKTDPTCCDCGVPGGDVCTGGGVCATASCDCGLGTCNEVPVVVPGGGTCCESGDHAACDDKDPCTADLCVENLCRHTESIGGATGCCAKDAECDDGNPCTAEGCDVNTHLCVTTKAPLDGPGCCSNAAVCDDGNPTTIDACTVYRCVNTPDANYCSNPSSSDVVINELMIDPAAVSDALGEWIELSNRTNAPIDLSAWSLTELGGTPQSVTLSPDAPLVLPAQGYLVLCRNGDTSTNGGVTCGAVYGNGYTLANAADDVILRDKAGAVADTVSYDGGPNFPAPDGASIALTNSGADNDVGASWKASSLVGPAGGDAGTPGGKNVDVYALLVSTACHEQPVDNTCTIDTCAGDACDHVTVEGCCNTAADCVVTDPCAVATCVNQKCVTEVRPRSECCLVNSDCDDGAVCSLDRCVGHACRHGSALTVGAGCCDTDADCGVVGNACVKSGCDTTNHVCLAPVAVAGAGCCTVDTYPNPANPSECDDGDPSTVDACKDYLCLSFPNPSYCEAQNKADGINNCALDGNPCTGTQCDLATKTCLFDVITTCCQATQDCFDGDPCTADTCNLKSGACAFKPIAGCCTTSQEAADCDDGSPCTSDRCIDLQPVEGSGGDFFGRCRNVFDVQGCCASAADCDDGNACTTDTCTASGCKSTPVVLAAGQVCCDATIGPIAAQCGDGDTCTSDVCTANRCAHKALPDVGDASCCHTDQDAAVECDDGNPCTLDTCLFGWCKHVLSAETDCCATDLDCNDLDACTSDLCASVGGKKICTYSTFNCDDGVFCNGAESCNPSIGCQTTSVVPLSDGIPCTVDACNEVLDAVVHTPNNVVCDDGKFCDGAEVCDPVVGCKAGASPLSDDGVSCTQDVCNETNNDFDHLPVDALCDDGKSCTGTETCSATLGCQKGSGGVALSDGISCTVDICDDATGGAAHIPDDSLCDDGLACTTDTCSPSGCKSPLAAGFCLIDGACRTTGTKSPTSACLACVPSVSTSAWSPVAGATETCNGQDDDCDGLTDEGPTGLPLTQPCQNACGGAGVETCVLGTYVSCSAPKLIEICGDGKDNDCDGVTDGAACAAQQLPVIGAEVRFTSTRGQVSNLITDKGDGSYVTGIYDLVNPNESGTTSVTAYGKVSTPLAYSVKAAGALQVEVIAMRDTLYVDNAEERFAVQVRDIASRPVATGTPVTVSISGSPLAVPVTVNGATDVMGRAILTWPAPASVFTAGGSLTAVVDVLGVKSAPVAITAVPAPAALVLPSVGGGIALPKSPRFTGDTFDVPVTLNTGVLKVAIYDVHINFNRFMVQVVGVTGGSCSAFASQPVSNVTGNANTTGTLLVNKQSDDFSAACSQGTAVHVATVTFKVLPGLTPDDPTVSAAFTGNVEEMRDANLVKISGVQPILVADGTNVDDTGIVKAWSAAPMGIFARAPDVQLLAWKPVTGVSDNSQLEVLAYRRDYTTAEVSASPLTTFANDAATVLTVSPTGSIVPSTQAGVATVAITHKGFVSTAAVSVLQPGPVTLDISDVTLEPVKNAVTAAAVQALQTATVRARVSWSNAAGIVFEQDVTDRFAAAGQVVTPGAVAYDPTEHRLTSTVAGAHVVSLRTPQGTTVATNTLTVAPAAPVVTCEGLDVVAPCTVVMDSIDPSPPTVLLGQTAATARVSATMSSYGQKCQVQVYARTSDGARMKLTGQNGVTVTSADALIASATATGMLTAISAGTVNVDAKWQLASGVICTGSAPVKVDLPTPIQIIATPSVVTLAISAADPAATIKKLPTGQQLAVSVVYSDGTTQDFTTTATYDETTGDPKNLLSVTSAGYITTTTAGAGTATINVKVSLYPSLAAAVVTVDVIKAAGLLADTFETYTPVVPRVSDKTLSFIEGTTTRQDALFEVLMTFTDGSSADVTQDALLSITPLNPATSLPQPGIVVFDKTTRRVTASAPGTVDVLFGLGSLVSKISGVTVDSAKEGVTALAGDGPVTTFSGIKDLGTTTVKVWCTMGDGTRRRLYDSRFVPNLLSFGSSNATGATIAASGVATIRGNALTNFTVDIASGVDVGAVYDPPLSLPTPCNLLPACGDFDLGDSVGLAYKDRTAGTVFTLEMRVNTCAEALGAFDVTFTYDKAVLQVVSADPAGATVGNVFSANWLGVPGSILMNGLLNPQAAAQVGDGLPVATITFKALKGGDHLSEMGGSVTSLFAMSTNAIGPATPRAFVAVIGVLDPP